MDFLLFVILLKCIRPTSIHTLFQNTYQATWMLCCGVTGIRDSYFSKMSGYVHERTFLCCIGGNSNFTIKKFTLANICASVINFASTGGDRIHDLSIRPRLIYQLTFIYPFLSPRCTCTIPEWEVAAKRRCYFATSFRLQASKAT